MRKVLVKICGITSGEDALLCEGADFLGFIAVSSSPRFCPPERIKSIPVPPGAEKVVVVKDAKIKELVPLLDTTNWFQLHGYEGKDVILFLKEKGKKVIKAVFPEDERSVELAQSVADYVDFFLIDSLKKYSKGESARALGTEKVVRDGKVFGKDFFLSGGLTPSDVCEAIKRFSPAGVDVASGVEEKPGKKSKKLVKLFLKNAKECAKTTK